MLDFLELLGRASFGGLLFLLGLGFMVFVVLKVVLGAFVPDEDGEQIRFYNQRLNEIDRELESTEDSERIKQLKQQKEMTLGCLKARLSNSW